MNARSIAPVVLLLVSACCAFLAASAAGQVPGFPPPRAGSAAAPAAAPDTADSAKAREAIVKAQADAQAQVAAIEAAIGTPQETPPGTSVSEAAQRLTLARQLTGLYQQQLDALDRGDAALRRQRETERANENWRGFDTPGPHSVLQVDALRDELDSAERRIVQADVRRALFERIEGQFAAKLKTSQADARLAAEAADAARGTPQAPRRDWLRDFAALRALVDSETAALLQMGARSTREEAAAAASARDFARRKLAAVGTEVVLSPEDLGRIVADLDARRRGVERDLDRATKASATALGTRAAAERRLADATAARDAKADAGAPSIVDLQRDADLARETAEMATQRVDLLRESLFMLDGEKAVWEARAEAMRIRDPVRARAAYERLTTSLAGIRAWMEYLDTQLAAIGSRVKDAEAGQRSSVASDAAHAQRLLGILRERERDLQRAIAGGEPLERLLARFRADFEERRDVSLAARAKDALAGAWLGTRRLWNFEIFTVDDSLETADGRRIAVSRSVTLGKTFGAMLIVIVGYWLCSLVARRIERAVVARGRIPPQSAALLRKWALFVLAAVLVILALVSASIPLTVFAFLGGALAIAAGFGLQNLLKNLVAGIMLLIERPIRLGDLVDVDGIRGRITEIGIRASTVRSADGIESMIPNSRFVEGNVTNWTYTSPQTRQSIAIGVTYGTPLRKASDVLLEVLNRHGRVLRDPAPQVYLDGYADSAINFALTYWVEMTVDSDTRRVKSDLLHMIDRAFGEAGISMPFPQRDVHLDVGRPVPVQIVAPSGGAGGSG